MHSLSGIIAMNNKAVRDWRARQKEEGKDYGETDRRCSYFLDPDKNVILHSAKQRSTVFLSTGPKAKKFLAAWAGMNSDEAHDKLVESYFSTERRASV